MCHTHFVWDTNFLPKFVQKLKKITWYPWFIGFHGVSGLFKNVSEGFYGFQGSSRSIPVDFTVSGAYTWCFGDVFRVRLRGFPVHSRGVLRNFFERSREF